MHRRFICTEHFNKNDILKRYLKRNAVPRPWNETLVDDQLSEDDYDQLSIDGYDQLSEVQILEVTKPSKTYSTNKKEISEKNEEEGNRPVSIRKFNSSKRRIDRPIVSKLRNARRQITSIITKFFQDIDKSYSYMKAFSESTKLEKQGLPLSEEGVEVKALGNGILAMKKWIGEF